MYIPAFDAESGSLIPDRPLLDWLDEQCAAVPHKPAAETDRFLADVLCTEISRLLGSHPPEEYHERVFQTIARVIPVLVHLLNRPGEPHPVVRLLMRRIFLGEQEFGVFFCSPVHGMLGSDRGAAAFNGVCAKLPQQGASRYFIRLLNMANSEGLFDTVLRTLSAGERPLPLPILETFVRVVIYVPWRCYSRTWLREYWPKLLGGAIQRVQNAAVEEIEPFGVTRLLFNTAGIVERLRETHGRLTSQNARAVRTDDVGAEDIGDQEDVRRRLQAVQLHTLVRLLRGSHRRTRLLAAGCLWRTVYRACPAAAVSEPLPSSSHVSWGPAGAMGQMTPPGTTDREAAGPEMDSQADAAAPEPAALPAGYDAVVAATESRAPIAATEEWLRDELARLPAGSVPELGEAEDVLRRVGAGLARAVWEHLTGWSRRRRLVLWFASAQQPSAAT